QIGQRLVWQKDFGFDSDGTGESDALLLPSGELRWVSLSKRCQTNQGERGFYLLGDCPDALIGRRGRPKSCVSDNGTEKILVNCMEPRWLPQLLAQGLREGGHRRRDLPRPARHRCHATR